MRLWSTTSVQLKYLIIIVPLTVALTAIGVGLVQYRANEAATQRAINQFSAVGQRAAEALSEEFWNYNVTQAQAILESLLLIPNVLNVSSIELANGDNVENSGFEFSLINSVERVEQAVWQNQLAVRSEVFDIVNTRDKTNPELIGQLTLSYSLHNLFEQNRWKLSQTLLSSLPIAIALILGSLLVLNLLILKPIIAVTHRSEDGSNDTDIDTGYEPIIWNSGDQLGILVSAFNDLRERQVQNLSQLKEARDDAIAANEAKSRFLAVMSHELRTPLNTIIGISETIEKNYDRLSDDKRKNSLNRVNTSGRHLLAMINEILDLSKIEAGKMDIESKPLDICHLLTECLSISESLGSKNNNSFQLQLAENLDRCWADPTRLRQIVLNLLSNAAKFTQNDCITISAAISDNQTVSVSVHDNGIGISKDQAAKLFQDFQQAEASTARKYGGTGLGLSISRKLARVMGGDISLSSEPDVGSTFTVTLPRYTGQDQATLATIAKDDNHAH